jgi:hypothetical protein
MIRRFVDPEGHVARSLRPDPKTAEIERLQAEIDRLRCLWYDAADQLEAVRKTRSCAKGEAFNHVYSTISQLCALAVPEKHEAVSTFHFGDDESGAPWEPWEGADS